MHLEHLTNKYMAGQLGQQTSFPISKLTSAIGSAQLAKFRIEWFMGCALERPAQTPQYRFASKAAWCRRGSWKPMSRQCHVEGPESSGRLVLGPDHDSTNNRLAALPQAVPDCRIQASMSKTLVCSPMTLSFSMACSWAFSRDLLVLLKVRCSVQFAS